MSNANTTPGTTGRSTFEIETVCSLPKNATTHSRFANLSGGEWKKDGVMNEEWDYSCTGDKGVKLLEDETGIVFVDYATIGGKNDVKYISIEYTASYPARLDGSEQKLRKEYLEFVDDLAKHLFGQALPAKVKTDLSGRKEHNKKDTGTRVGDGYINYLLSSPLPKAVDIDIKLFRNEAEYNKYKDE